MKLYAILYSVCIFISAVYCVDEVPVIVWGSGADLFDYHVPAFKKLSTSEFHDSFVKKFVSNELPAVGLFVEESLSLEDLSSQNVDDKYAYPTLQSKLETESSSKFLPYVNNPLKAFRALNEENYNIIEHQDLQNSSRVVVIMQLDDVKDDEDRSKLMTRHDALIQDSCMKLQEKYGKVACVLTAKRPSWIESTDVSPRRKLLQVIESSNISTPIHYFKSGIGLIYTKTPPVFVDKPNNTTYELKAKAQVTKQSNNAMSVRFPGADGIRLVFNFKNQNLTWVVDKVDLSIGRNNTRIELEPQSFIGASVGNSFHTPSKVVFDSDKYSLTFNTLQVQYKTDNAQFGPAEDTVYFFTIPILSGLFVSSILVSIILFGLSMIFDIKTMDQFDDPKGKSITINASE